jgi:hypothetical protein
MANRLRTLRVLQRNPGLEGRVGGCMNHHGDLTGARGPLRGFVHQVTILDFMDAVCPPLARRGVEGGAFLEQLCGGRTSLDAVVEGVGPQHRILRAIKSPIKVGTEFCVRSISLCTCTRAYELRQSRTERASPIGPESHNSHGRHTSASSYKTPNFYAWLHVSRASADSDSHMALYWSPRNGDIRNIRSGESGM